MSKKYKIEEEEKRPSKFLKNKHNKNKTWKAVFSMLVLVLRMNDFLL